jgi:hypothetical protein
MKFRLESILNTVLLCFLAVFACSCNSLVYKSNLELRKGQPKVIVKQILENDSYIDDFSDNDFIKIDEAEFNHFGNIELIIKKRYYIDDYQYYIYAFRDDKLIYWGYPVEFTRSGNELLYLIGRKAADIIKEKDM